MDDEEVISKAKEFEKNNRIVLETVLNKHKQFLKLFPFWEHPEEIDMLTPEKLYNPGTQDYFVHWVEFKKRFKAEPEFNKK